MPPPQVNEFEELASFSAGLRRLATFVERMEGYQAAAASNTSATFALSAERLAKMTKAEEERTYWEMLTRPDDTATPPPSPPPPSPPEPAADLPASAAPSADVILNTQLAMLPADQALAVRELSLRTPDGARTLFCNVSLVVGTGDHLLITGNSGTGKSSLLRAIAGLWTRGTGEVTRPLTAETMFLPQRPYCTLGSLRQQLVYPATAEGWAEGGGTDAELLRALEDVQLPALAGSGAEGLDEVRDWGDELSLGEQQRLAFARVLVRKPQLAILDEATSALDLGTEAAMYGALGRSAGLTYVSVGHRPSLLRFHAARLRLYGLDQTPSYAIDVIDGDDRDMSGMKQ